jgi:hypothetical protein
MTPSLLPKRLPWSLVFSFGNRLKSEGVQIRNIGGWGRISKPQSVSAVIATLDVWAGALSCSSKTPLVSLLLIRASSWRSRFNSSAIVRAVLAQDCQSRLSPDYHKKCKQSSSLLMASSWISSEDSEPECFHCMFCFFGILYRSYGPMFRPELQSGR